MLSVIIPALNEFYLQPTIDNVLANARGEIEIIAVLDGYWPDPMIKDDPRVRLIHNTEPRGQRHSINDAARFARGKYMMKLDAHCTVSEGFDVILAEDCKPEWTMVPRMYNLDINTFTEKKHKRTDYMYIGLEGGHIRARYYGGSSGVRQPRNKKEIDEIMCCMGPGWFMHMDRFFSQGGCDENHGHWGQQGCEVALKAWMSGGALMVNKRAWFAHWFRGSHKHTEGPGAGRKGFPYSIKQRQIVKAREYSDDLWLNGKWEHQVEDRDFWWLVKKFNPPSWGHINMDYPTEKDRHKLLPPFYKHIHRRKNDASWRGVDILKLPNDLTLYAEAIEEKKPDLIVEIGTKWGGSALYFQDMLDAICGPGQGRVITIDHKNQLADKDVTPDPRIEYIVGSSLNKENRKDGDWWVIQHVKEAAAKCQRVMLVIDGNHERTWVKWELHHYRDIVSRDQFMVVEDCYIDRGLYGPGEARDWFLNNYSGFVQTDRCVKYLVGITMGGWLKKT